MRKIWILLCGLLLTMVSLTVLSTDGVQVYAHRGTREYFPENTIPAYKFAVRMHANWLDADVHLTKDGQLVIIHDDTLPMYYLKDANGQYVNTVIYVNDLTLSQLQSYYMGPPRPATLYAFLFPQQRIVGKVRMPTLEDAVATMDRYSSSPVYWQLEIKTNPTNPKLSDYKAITTKLVDFLQAHHMVDRVEVQAFDWRALRLIHQLNPKIHTAALLDHTEASFKHQPSPLDGVWTAGMKPEKYQWNYVAMAHAIGAYCYEPFEKDLTPGMVTEAHDLGMKVVPWHWAENQGSHIDVALTNQLIDMGVDGLIVDDLPGTEAIVAQRDLQSSSKPYFQQ